MDEFISKIDVFDNPKLIRKLIKLYLINPDEAYTQYRIALARKIADENKSLFERLADL